MVTATVDAYLSQTLRDSASDNEKQQFLKEALLMSTIKHENVVSLLGVCLDTDAQLIILELMDGGDLLAYLRVHRAQNVRTEHAHAYAEYVCYMS